MNHTLQRLKSQDWRGYALPLLLLTLWALSTHQGWVNTKLIVPPEKVISVGWTELGKSSLYAGVAWSIGRDLVGLLIGALSGIAVGILLGVSPLADRTLGPTFHTVRQISLFAWLPLLSALVGTGDLSKVIFIAFSAFYPIVLGTLEGVKGVSLPHIEVARVHGFTRVQVLTRLILPSAAPQIAGGARLGLIYAWLATIGSEFLLVSEGNGIGSIVFRGRAAFNVELILFGLLIIGLIGALFNRLANQAEQRLLPWRAAQR
jgi:sulfonate transport system permease protein